MKRVQTRSGGDEHATIRSIEDARAEFLKCSDPLSDGSMGDVFPAERNLTVRDACQASRPPKAAWFLYMLAREFQPVSAIELGTSLGISTAYIALALAENDRQGHIVTLEGSPYRQKLAQRLFNTLGLHSATFEVGLFEDILEPVLQRHAPLDFAFIDGHHRYRPTLDYMDAIWKHTQGDAILVFDDIRWSQEMRRAWRDIKHDRRVKIALDLHSMGVCVTSRDQIDRHYATDPIYFVFS